MRLRAFLAQVVLVSSLSVLSVIVYGPSTAKAALGGDPTGVSAETKAGTASATVKWTAPSGVTRYRVRAFIGAVSVKSAAISSGSATSYTFTGLEFDIPYTLKVTAGDASSWGNEIASSATVTPKPDSPSAPAQPAISVVADMTIEATWTPPVSSGGAPVEKYSVQLKKEGENVNNPVTTTSLSIQLTTPDATSQYAVSVKAINSAGLTSPESEDSTSIAATLKEATVVTTPVPNQDNLNPGTGNTPENVTAPVAPPAGGGLSQTPVAAAPANSSVASSPGDNPAPQAVSSGSMVVSFVRSVAVKSRTRKSSILALSRLAGPKGARISYVVLASSKKYCALTSTAVTATRVGTCKIKVTVTVGKKSKSQTVTLNVKKSLA